jgi:hypothetical protein
MVIVGIFFDEILGLYDWREFLYLKQAKEEVKAAAGLGEKLVGKR